MVFAAIESSKKRVAIQLSSLKAPKGWVEATPSEALKE
jgi:hypothetical protein